MVGTKNKNKLDNRLNNLEVIPKGKHIREHQLGNQIARKHRRK